MKKFVLVSLFALAGLGAVFAAGDGNISLSGTVTPWLELTLSANSFTDNELSHSGESWAIGTAKFISNYKNYTIRAWSTNASNLQATIDTVVYNIPYTFTLGDATDGYVFGASGAGITLGSISAKNSKTYTTRTSKTGITYDVKVDIAGSGDDLWEPGAYTDTIYLEIVHP